LFLISIIVICFSVAELTSSIDYPLHWGHFLAGLSISESEYSHQALASVVPFLDTFITSVFFVSIGMLLNVQVLATNLSVVIMLTIAMVILKL
jgi:CPA2 family monovalent cation:H+ antiporter-2